MLDKISVITPTFNRHRFALRAANYYRAIGVKAIYADGTLEKNSALETVSTHSKYITYHHQPEQSWSERMQKNICSVDTKYVVISADDEFHLKSGLIASLELLEADINAACAVGRSAKFKCENGHVNLGQAYNYISGYSQKNPIERTAKLLHNYSPFPCYSVWRTNHLKAILEILSKTMWSSWRVDEIIHVAAAGLLGNCLVHEGLQWLRSDENPPSKTPKKKQIEMDEWYYEKNLENEHSAFCEILSKLMTGEFFVNYNDSEKKNVALYLLENYLLGQKFHRSLVLGQIKPQKTFKQASTNGFKFIKNHYSTSAEIDFGLVNKVVVDFHSH